jgi:CRISPR-associated helicase Cas3
MLNVKKHVHSFALKGLCLNRYNHPSWKEFPLFSFQYLLLEKQAPTLVETPCGFGKTFAALIPSLIESRKKTFFVFPSNALVETQYSSVKSRLAEWGFRNYAPLKLTGDDLLEYMNELGYDTKGKALYDLITREMENIVFTNIDIMFNILSQKYSQRRDIVSTLKASRVIFDEFHFYKNVTAVLLGVMYEKLVNFFTKDIYFLSATPSKTILELLTKIHPIACELSIKNNVNITPSDEKEVMFSTKLEISPESEQDVVDSALSFVSENYDKNPLGMVILDSIRDSIILARRLKENGFKKVFLYTGLKKEKLDDVEKGIIVGTSAIEVGVDKKVDYLFFEANNTTTFLQRFGRVGRKGEGTACAVVNWDLYNQLRDFEQNAPIDRLRVLESLSKRENRFPYARLYHHSEFQKMIRILDKLYDPDASLTESEKENLRALNARDSVSIFVHDRKTRHVFMYDVLRTVRDYLIEECYHSLRDIEDLEMDDLSMRRIDYFSEFSIPLVAEVEDLDDPRERRVYPKFDGTIFYISGGKRVLDYSFKNLKERNLFKRVLQNSVLREEGCVQVRDNADSSMAWVWGFSSKLV